MEQKDLCNLFLVADRRLSQAFITDMMSQGALGAADDAGGLDGRRESLLGEFLGEQQVGQGPVTGRGPRARVEEVVETRLPAPKDPGVCCDQPVPREPPCAGAAVRGYIQEVLPELARLAKALGRCGVLVCVVLFGERDLTDRERRRYGCSRLSPFFRRRSCQTARVQWLVAVSRQQARARARARATCVCTVFTSP